MDIVKILLILILLLFVYVKSQKNTESFISNQRPNEEQFHICGSSLKDNSYLIFQNSIPKPPSRKGIFTQLKYTDYSFKPYNPDLNCNSNIVVNKNDYFPTNKIIEYKTNTYKPLVDPWDPYTSPNNNNILTYHHPKIIKNFLDNFKKNKEPEIIQRKYYPPI